MRATARPVASVASLPFEIRSLRPRDDASVRAIFHSSFLLGRPLDFRLALADDYAEVCLGWFLGPARDDAALAVDRAGSVLGYALLATDTRAMARWAGRRTSRLLGSVLTAALSGRMDRRSLHFYVRRAGDSTRLWIGARSAPQPAIAHLNVVKGARTGAVASALVAHLDARCRLAGQPGWCAEINAPEGQRRAALQRLGLTVVRSDRNRTASALTGSTVTRLTVSRDIGLRVSPDVLRSAVVSEAFDVDVEVTQRAGRWSATVR